MQVPPERVYNEVDTSKKVTTANETDLRILTTFMEKFISITFFLPFPVSDFPANSRRGFRY